MILPLWHGKESACPYIKPVKAEIVLQSFHDGLYELIAWKASHILGLTLTYA